VITTGHILIRADYKLMKSKRRRQIRKCPAMNKRKTLSDRQADIMSFLPIRSCSQPSSSSLLAASNGWSVAAVVCRSRLSVLLWKLSPIHWSKLLPRRQVSHWPAVNDQQQTVIPFGCAVPKRRWRHRLHAYCDKSAIWTWRDVR